MDFESAMQTFAEAWVAANNNASTSDNGNEASTRQLEVVETKSVKNGEEDSDDIVMKEDTKLDNEKTVEAAKENGPEENIEEQQVGGRD